MKTLAIATALLLSTTSAQAQRATPAAPPPPHLTVLGTPHLANHHRDIANANVEDVLTPARQREMMQIVTALAATRPNHVAIDWSANKQSELDARYAAYRAGRYTLTADEVDQIGLRVDVEPAAGRCRQLAGGDTGCGRRL